MRKVFLEKAVLEPVYKFDEKSYRECLKGKSIAKVRFNFFLTTNIYIYIYQDTKTNHFTPLALHVRGNYDSTITYTEVKICML